MTLEDSINENNDLINPRCLFNNELRYRSIEPSETVQGKQAQYCLLADDLCPYYKAVGQHDYCMNYDGRYK